jgi:hypothetical protein
LSEEPRLPAEITDRALATVNFESGYQGLIDSFRAVANARRIPITSADVDETAGTPRYFIAKLLSPNAMRNGKGVRRFGSASLGPLLAILGVKLVVCDDPIAVARYTSKLPTRNEACTHPMLTAKSGRGGHTLTPLRLLRRMAPLGAAARNAALSPRRRSQLARRAALVRWQKVRAAAKAAKRRAPAQAKAA